MFDVNVYVISCRVKIVSKDKKVLGYRLEGVNALNGEVCHFNVNAPEQPLTEFGTALLSCRKPSKPRTKKMVTVSYVVLRPSAKPGFYNLVGHSKVEIPFMSMVYKAILNNYAKNTSVILGKLSNITSISDTSSLNIVAPRLEDINLSATLHSSDGRNVVVYGSRLTLGLHKGVGDDVLALVAVRGSVIKSIHYISSSLVSH